MFYTWGCLYAPYIHIPPVHLDTAIHSDTPNAPICSNTSHMSPMLPYTSVCSGVYACDRGMLGPSLCLDASPCIQHPLCIICSPTCLYFLGVIACTMGNIQYVGGLGASAHPSGFWCLSVHPLDVPLCFILYLSYSSLCLLPPLQLLLLQLLWCLLVCHLYHQ